MNLKINPNKRVIGGLTPSNHLHIGNYIGGLSLYKELQQKDYDIFLFVSDLHGLSPVKPDYDGL
ncbi:hypothetical protein FACS189459_2080 [Bacilli bacterium]|nr:hypothetical protein FACS189459_2080 [Bacilli bacterium]